MCGYFCYFHRKSRKRRSSWLLRLAVTAGAMGGKDAIHWRPAEAGQDMDSVPRQPGDEGSPHAVISAGDHGRVLGEQLLCFPQGDLPRSHDSNDTAVVSFGAIGSCSLAKAASIAVRALSAAFGISWLQVPRLTEGLASPTC